jgi:hypothetical protein
VRNLWLKQNKLPRFDNTAWEHGRMGAWEHGSTDEMFGLAYFDRVISYKCKPFMKSTSGVDVSKPVFFVADAAEK